MTGAFASRGSQAPGSGPDGPAAVPAGPWPDRPVLRAGTLPYLEARALQEWLHGERVAGRRGDTLLTLEHPPVITLGRSGGEEFLRTGDPRVRGVEVVRTDRGGKITYHGPGQLVGYGIVALAPRRLSPASYVHRVERVLVEALDALGLPTGTVPGRVGIWTGAGRKVASIGVRVARGVTLHGFALNVSTDLAPFAGMTPCGLEGVEMTSTNREGLAADLEQVRGAVEQRWRGLFAATIDGADHAEGARA